MSLIVLGQVFLCWVSGSFVSAAPPEPNNELSRFEYTEPHMGVTFKIVLYAGDETTANQAAEAAFGRVEELNKILSDYDPQSELSRLSETAGSGKRVPVSEELWFVLQKADRLSRLSEGAFDVTIGAPVKLWRRARRSKEMPDARLLNEALATVGYEQIHFHPEQRAVTLMKPGTRLDLGGIAKGYAADEALGVLKKLGISRALVAASGDVVLGDAPPDAESWRVAIAPLDVSKPAERFLMLDNCAVSTSGDAFQFVEIDGRRYSHILNPKTGVGLTNRGSVTVVAPAGIDSDSLASAVCILGTERGLEMLAQLPDTAALIVTGSEEQPQETLSRGMRGLLHAGE